MARAKVLQLAWITLLAVTVCLVVAIRIRLLDVPLERDEGEYAYAGQLMLQGVPPYQLAYNMKFPGTYAAYAALMAVFGQTTRGVHLGLLVVNLATVGLIFLLGKRLLGLAAACAAAASYAVLSVSPSVQGFAGHATHFVVLPVMAGLLLLLVARRSPAAICASGALFGLGVLMKQPGAAFVLAGVVSLFWLDTREGMPLPRRLLRSTIFGGGALLPFIFTCLLLWQAGAFGQFWFWTFEYAREYGSQASFEEAVRNFTFGIRYVVGSEVLLWVLALAGVVATVRTEGSRMLLPLLIFSTIAVAAGFYFRPHYFILALPAVALLAGATTQLRGTFVWPVLFASALAWPLFAHRDFFFRLPPEAASRHVYGTNPFPESQRIGEFLRENTTLEDTIAIIGSEPQIYFYANRRSATGHIYTYGLMEQHQYATRMQEEMVREIEAARPKFIVFVTVAASWLRRPESSSLLVDWFNDYSARELQPAGYVGIVSPTQSEYHLPLRDEPLTQTETHLTIWQRRL